MNLGAGVFLPTNGFPVLTVIIVTWAAIASRVVWVVALIAALVAEERKPLAGGSQSGCELCHRSDRGEGRRRWGSGGSSRLSTNILQLYRRQACCCLTNVRIWSGVIHCPELLCLAGKQRRGGGGGGRGCVRRILHLFSASSCHYRGVLWWLSLSPATSTSSYRIARRWRGFRQLTTCNLDIGRSRITFQWRWIQGVEGSTQSYIGGPLWWWRAGLCCSTAGVYNRWLCIWSVSTKVEIFGVEFYWPKQVTR